MSLSALLIIVKPIELSSTVVPEPSSISFLMVSAAFLGRRPRNRRRSMAPRACTPSRSRSPHRYWWLARDSHDTSTGF